MKRKTALVGRSPAEEPTEFCAEVVHEGSARGVRSVGADQANSQLGDRPGERESDAGDAQVGPHHSFHDSGLMSRSDDSDREKDPEEHGCRLIDEKGCEKHCGRKHESVSHEPAR